MSESLLTDASCARADAAIGSACQGDIWLSLKFVPNRFFSRQEKTLRKGKGSNVFGPDAPSKSLEQGSLTESRPNPSNLALDLRQRLLYPIKQPKEFRVASARVVRASSIAPDYGRLTFLDR
ncbi:MAG: hypothetical protein OXH93_08350, partial [Caldilineaceae bacterium]|nr:hypothetical protein [Caldilineaceae bacterium]